MKHSTSHHLQKAREAMLLAIEVYNKPATAFKTYGYVVLVVIAWTALFHAIFEKRGTRYFYKDKKNKRKYLRVDGELKAWELDTCIDKYYLGQENPVSKNLQFLIGLRNKIEHRFLPQIDNDVFGECQAALLNFENVLEKEFGGKYAINANLAYSLQTSREKPKSKEDVYKKLQIRALLNTRTYIEEFRNALPSHIHQSPEYSFKIFLIPKITNHASSSDLAVEFVRYDADKPEEMSRYSRLVTFIKEKEIQHVVAAKDSEKDNAQKVVLTRDATKASGRYVHETVSEELFSEINNIVDAAKLLMRRVDDFPLTAKLISLIYGYREEVKDTGISKIFVENSYLNYLPYLFWLKHLDDNALKSFVCSVAATPKYPQSRFVIRIALLTGGKCLQLFKDSAKSVEKLSQKPEWYWALEKLSKIQIKSVVDLTKLSQESVIDGASVASLLQDPPKAKALLNLKCREYAKGTHDNKALLRDLDLICYGAEIKEKLCRCFA